MRKRKVCLSGILAVTMILSITACGGGENKTDSASGTATSTAKNSLVSSSASAGNASASVEGEEKMLILHLLMHRKVQTYMAMLL